MDSQAVNIVIGGEAGQGLVTVGQLLAKSLVRSGYDIVVTQNYQSRIRGGHNTFVIRTGSGPLHASREAVDVLVALDRNTIEVVRQELAPHAVVVVDSKLVEAPELGGSACLRVPFAQLGQARTYNVAGLGVVGALLGLDRAVLLGAVEGLFGKKHPEAVAENRKTLEAAYLWTQDQKLTAHRLPAPVNARPRLMVNGNEAIALGALSAGVKFCAFYPMSPSTSIPLTLAGEARRLGLVVEQAEDEIAAVNMAIGASFAGAPSMVASAGGGFALMGEGVSLAAMTETPLVIAVAQRPGPATGLPTRTEQADLEMVLHAGHGEFPRAVLAPGTVEECFHLTRTAFEWAEHFQTPIFILTDQMLADSYRAVEPFDLKALAPVTPGHDPAAAATPYERYAITADGVSPRLLPGMSSHLVVADSDEHTPDGHLTEDLNVRRAMVEKRLRKLGGLYQQVVPPQWDGDGDAELLLVTWGSSRGAVLEAAAQMRAEQRIATLCFSQVWPLAPDQFLSQLQQAQQVVSVEGNATGQFARLIRRETGFVISRLVLRYDGLPLTPEYIISRLTH